MAQIIDVTGLSREAIRAVESLVGILRESQRQPTAATQSIFELFGKAEVLRTGEDIAEQLREERDSWGEA
ncbi:MAG TPA: hypothetical protein VLM40_08185 [Gemmata sp.]|nr:hypothetical protein [Gemmata sp.]